jgi:hypothetical protein
MEKAPDREVGRFSGGQLQCPSAISQATSARALRMRSWPQVSMWPKNLARAPFSA